MEKIYNFYLAEVNSNGDVVNKISEITGDAETVLIVSRRKLGVLRKELKGDAPASADVAPETDETSATA